MYNQNNNTPRPAQSFGSVQETFRYNLAKSFNSGDEFTIVEDMPKNKHIRFEVGEGKAKDGRKFESKTYLIRVSVRGYEADMLVYPKLLPTIATLCPKGLENFKGTTFVFDGQNWSYMGIQTQANTQVSVSSISAAMRDTRQPDLSEPSKPVDQVMASIDKMCEDMKKMYSMNSPEYKIDIKVLTNVANSILPGKALELIQAAKAQGAIYEQPAGVYKVS